MGQFRTSGPKQRTRSGPKSAQQIPWPEIFKRHISQIEGHLKMTDMIKRHTVERSANWDTICSLIDQTKEMLRTTKIQSRVFMPPFNTRDQVLIGSSSPSMHPEYLSVDYEQGNAAEECDQSASETRNQDADIKPAESDDALGQERRAKRTKFGHVRASIAAHKSGTGSGLNGPVANSSEPRAVNGLAEGPKAEGGMATSANGDEAFDKGKPLFVIDVNPTPVNLAGITIQSPKRGPSLGDNDEGKQTKKAKTYQIDDNVEPSPPEKAEVEFEDISQEVDARLKEKEEKRKRKKGKKRKKGADVTSDVTAPDITTTAEEPGRPKKKNKFRQNYDAPVEATETKKRSGAESDEGQVERKRKRRKKNKGAKDS